MKVPRSGTQQDSPALQRRVEAIFYIKPLQGRNKQRISMLHTSFEQMGIPPGYGFRSLLFCGQASMLVLQARAIEGWRPDRLFARAASGERYEPLGAPGEMLSQEDPVLSPSHPLLAYNTFLHSFGIDAAGEEQHFGNWEAIRVLDLHTWKETHVVDKETLHLPDRELKVWIASLLSFTDKPETLHVVAGFKRSDAMSADYYVSELHLPTGLVRPLVCLPAVFL